MRLTLKTTTQKRSIYFHSKVFSKFFIAELERDDFGLVACYLFQLKHLYESKLLEILM